MVYHCLHCHKEEDYNDQAPATWYVKRYVTEGLYRRKCPKCGAAMAPVSFLRHEGRIRITGLVFRAFSDCISAEFCMGHNLYTPDCENGIVKTKCFYTLLWETTDIRLRLDRLEKRRPPQKQQPSKKASQGSDT
jgi:hypothetical protein